MTSAQDNYTPDFEVLYPDIRAAQTTDRIKVLRFGDVYSMPGTCVVCRCTLEPDKEFIDLGLDIEFYGAIYVCTICMNEVFQLCRYISVDGDYHKKLFNGYKAAVQEVGNLRKELTEIRAEVVQNVISGIGDYINNLDPVNFASSVTLASIPKRSVENNESNDSSSTVISEGTGSDGPSSKPSNEQGSSDLFDFAELDTLFDEFKF